MIIKELDILTKDLVGTEEYYNQVLDFPVLSKGSSSISFAVGHSVLTFHYTSDVDPVYHFAFNVPENKLAEAFAWVGCRAVILPYSGHETIADYTNWNAHAFYFHDNNNNILEFITHHDLQNQSQVPFTAASLTGICESGMAVDDVSGFCENIHSSYKIPYFQKGPRLPEFTVMGDASGLLIVNQSGRGWVPTQQAVQQYYTKILIENDGIQHVIILDPPVTSSDKQVSPFPN
jgi:hypothetical protein